MGYILIKKPRHLLKQKMAVVESSLLKDLFIMLQTFLIWPNQMQILIHVPVI